MNTINNNMNMGITSRVEQNSFINNSLLLTGENCYKPNEILPFTVSIHTEDRDTKKWPDPSKFLITLPEVMKNVTAIELIDIRLPTFYYSISENLQNNSFYFSIPQYFQEPILLNKLVSGYYAGENLAVILKNALNKTTMEYLFKIGALTVPDPSFNDFDVLYNPSTNKLTVINKSYEFKLWFNKSVEYNHCENQYYRFGLNWGLGYNMGFDKKLYTSVFDEVENNFRLTSITLVDIGVQSTIYMNVRGYNYVSQIDPFSQSTNSLFNNDYGASVDASFAKLIIQNVTNTYIPPGKFKRILPHVEGKIGQLFIEFKYHNGQYVEFLGQNFDFSFKFHTIPDCKYTT
jgi:hypothetical protein